MPENQQMTPSSYWHEEKADSPPPSQSENRYGTDNDNKCFIGEKRKIKSLMKSGWA